MANRLVCMCNFVDESEIIKLLEKGADSTSQIQSLTRAGTSCGRCLPEIDGLVADHKNTKPGSKQGKLRLGL